MLIRFAAAAVVASIAIALGALLIPFLFVFHPQGFGNLTRLWCFIPVLWGIWAMLTPRAWMPARLPQWGAILGLLLGVVAGLVLNVPARVFYIHLPVEVRVGGILFVGGFYYLLWLLVRRVFESLSQPSGATETQP